MSVWVSSFSIYIYIQCNAVISSYHPPSKLWNFNMPVQDARNKIFEWLMTWVMSLWQWFRCYKLDLGVCTVFCLFIVNWLSAIRECQKAPVCSNVYLLPWPYNLYHLLRKSRKTVLIPNIVNRLLESKYMCPHPLYPTFTFWASEML